MIDVKKIWLTPTDVWIQTSDGKQACEHFADYKGLRNATAKERERGLSVPATCWHCHGPR